MMSNKKWNIIYKQYCLVLSALNAGCTLYFPANDLCSQGAKIDNVVLDDFNKTLTFVISSDIHKSNIVIDEDVTDLYTKAGLTALINSIIVHRPTITLGAWKYR